MTIYTDSTGATYVIISPVKAKITDTYNCTRLYVSSANDNLSTACLLVFKFGDDNGNLALQDTKPLIGTDYTNWNPNDNTFPFTFISNSLPITVL